MRKRTCAWRPSCCAAAGTTRRGWRRPGSASGPPRPPWAPTPDARAARYAVLHRIFLGLSGDPDAAAKETLQVLNEARTDTDARDVLAALIL